MGTTVAAEYEQEEVELTEDLEKSVSKFTKEGWVLMSVYIRVCEPNAGRVFCMYSRDIKFNEYYPKETKANDSEATSSGRVQDGC